MNTTIKSSFKALQSDKENISDLSDQFNIEYKPKDEGDDNFVIFKGFIDECTIFEEALEILNFEGSKQGLAFKKVIISFKKFFLKFDRKYALL